MKKLMNPKTTVLILLSGTVLLSGCTDWQSKPVAVDESWGKSVKNMVEAQTLNPNAGYVDRPVLGIDGQKSQGAIQVYRAGSTDLKQGKEAVEFEVGN
ncbi:MAG: hypothetical protein KAJ63_15590 [Methyloprofundus sp.]|nr:hypothetical protein [Methyloprofundus sp.]